MNTREQGVIRREQAGPNNADVEKGIVFGPDADNATRADPEYKDVPPLRGLSFLDRFLVIWIALAMAIGIILGNFVPGTGPALQKGQFVGVSVPIAIGLLVMMYPILCKVRYETLHLLFSHHALWIQIGVSFGLNWIFCPLLMLGLAWAFLPEEPQLREGLIFVGIARCIAMVLVWTDLAGGDTDYCAVLVAFNSILQIMLFAPLAIFYVKVISGSSPDLDISYKTVATSVAVFLGIPLGAAIVTRLSLRRLLGEKSYQTFFIRFISPLSLVGLIFTIIILFASQGKHVVDQIIDVLRVMAPLIIYFTLTFSVVVFMCHKLGFGYRVSCTQSLTAASNNFELAIAVAVAVYGVNSDQALASTVGPLVEVPVLVSCVYILKWLKRKWGWKN